MCKSDRYAIISALLLSLFAVIGWPFFAHGAYVVEKGNGVQVCDSYLKVLNVPEPRMPFSSERPMNSASADIGGVDWLPSMVPSDAIVEFFWSRDANPAWYLEFPDQWFKWRGTRAQIRTAKKNYLDRIGTQASGYHESVSLRVAQVDIDNDGEPDKVAQLRLGVLATLLLVLSSDGSAIDHKRSQLVLQHPKWGEKSLHAFRKGNTFKGIAIEPVEDVLHGAQYGVFTHADKTYYDLWWLTNTVEARLKKPSINDWRLRVFVAHGADVTEACRFRFEFPSK